MSAQAVQQRRARLQALVTMPNDVAEGVLAQQIGLKPHQYIDDPDLLSRIATAAALVQEAEARRAGDGATVRSTQGQVKVTPTQSVLMLGGKKLRDGVLNKKHQSDAQRMSEVYPVLYLLENSIREYIDWHLSVAYGSDWWDDPLLVPRGPRESVKIVQKAANENRWHTSRKARLIYYTTLGNLVDIVRSEQGAKVFKAPRFPRPTWFPELVQRAEVSRNIVAHMNPLQTADIRRLELALEDWLRQTEGDRPPPAT